MKVAPSLPVRFAVIGPDQPVVVPPGEDAVLPCHLSPQTDAEDMTVRWFKGSYFSLVHLYHERADRDEQLMEEYRTRTLLHKDDIHAGKVSLVILNVSLSDSGQYMCFFKKGSFYEETPVELKVAALGSNPHIYLEKFRDEGIQIVCKSSGWYPEPMVLRKGNNGKNISSSAEVTITGGSRLFQVKTTYIITGRSDKFSCRIKNPMLGTFKESTIHISDNFVHSKSSCSTQRVVICFSFTTLGIIFIPLVVYLFKKPGRANLHARMGRLTKELKNLPGELNWRQARRFAEEVTLDPETAHPNLILSADVKSVRYGEEAQDVPNTTQRFKTYINVLGKQNITSGRHYREVEVGEKTGWALGVCDDLLNRKGKIATTPERGYWTVWLRDGRYSAHTSPWTFLTPSVTPKVIGLFLDYEKARLSIYEGEFFAVHLSSSFLPKNVAAALQSMVQ
ncbi:hypothetical protein NDU88_006989 [Pleurodeles waltl]|uniref:Butyrophilin subfamily 1 member A1-like n=1 Tax=Pleurodeles waltl TaxID=8319 RepID=A0AAV7MHN7_PLEWA|nr:hypothetical protein NDU88_006989 [Pleurodeles waltl]